MLLTIQTVCPYVIKNARLNLLLLIYILINAVQNYAIILFSVRLDRYVRTCESLNDLSYEVFIPNKTEDLSQSVVTMFTGINESKTLAKHLSFECKCKFHGRKDNSNHWWNKDKCRCECKTHQLCEKSCYTKLEKLKISSKYYG